MLLVGLGAPDGPDIPAVRSFLAESLTDPSVVTLPLGLKYLRNGLGRVFAWRLAARSSDVYRHIWQDRGSPLATRMADQDPIKINTFFFEDIKGLTPQWSRRSSHSSPVASAW